MTEDPLGTSPLPPRPLAAPAEIAEAIAAAVAIAWPAGTAPAPVPEGRAAVPEHMWRFSGRWWRPPLVYVRARPWPDRGDR